MKSYEMVIEVVQCKKVLVQAASRDDAESEVMHGLWTQVISQEPEYVRSIIKVDEFDDEQHRWA